MSKESVLVTVSEVHMNYSSISSPGEHSLGGVSRFSGCHRSLKVGVEALIRGQSTCDTCLERGPVWCIFQLFFSISVKESSVHINSVNCHLFRRWFQQSQESTRNRVEPRTFFFTASWNRWNSMDSCNSRAATLNRLFLQAKPAPFR